MDRTPFWRQNTVVGEGRRLTCPKCGANLTLALPPDGKGGQTFQCFDCDRPDPLKTEKAMRWLKSRLQPPTQTCGSPC